jgi:AcrR family transcriptional regulator
MSPRRRTIADLDIAEHAAQLLLEAGPGAVTFSQVAERCQLAPPTLVQRFGRKESLIEAAAVALRGRVAMAFMEAAREHRPLRGMIAALQSLASTHAAILRLASTSDRAAYSVGLRKQISFTLAMAVEASELPRCDVASLARTLQINFSGAVATALMEGSDAEAEVAAAIETQLADYIGR